MSDEDPDHGWLGCLLMTIAIIGILIAANYGLFAK